MGEGEGAALECQLRLTALFLIQNPANTPGKAANTAPCAWVSAAREDLMQFQVAGISLAHHRPL